MASQEGHVDVVKVLLSNGANQQSCTEVVYNYADTIGKSWVYILDH